MKATQLFLKINNCGLNNEWNEKISSLVKGLANIKGIQVISESETEAEINISYKVQKVPFNKILELVERTGAAIIEINMHLPSDIGGANDTHCVNAIDNAFSDGELTKVRGRSDITLSSKGVIKITLDPAFKNTLAVIEAIINQL